MCFKEFVGSVLNYLWGKKITDEYYFKYFYLSAQDL